MAGDNKIENSPNLNRKALKKMINTRQRKPLTCREPMKDGFIYKQCLTFEWEKSDNMKMNEKNVTNKNDGNIISENNNENSYQFYTFNRNYFTLKESIDIQNDFYNNILNSKTETYYQSKLKTS